MPDLVPLSELGKWGSGGTPLASEPKYYGGNIPWLIIEDLNDGLVMSAKKRITDLGLKNSSCKLIKPGTLMIAMYGSIGKLGIAGIECATNQAIAFCECNQALVDTKYLFYSLLTHRASLIRGGRGGTQQNISQEILKDYRIALPPLDEQKRIAALLAKADRLRRMRRYALQLSNTFLQSVFLEMFGDPATNPKGWEVTTIDDVVAFSQYGTSQKSNAQKQGYPVLGMGNISYSGEILLGSLAYVDLSEKEFQQLRLVPGDIIFNRTNSTELVGKTAHWNLPIDAVLASYLVKLQLDSRVLPDFFAALLNTAQYKHLFQERCKKAVGQSNISPTLLKEFSIYLPSLQTQNEFAAVLRRVERLRRQQREAERQAEMLFQSLLHRAFARE